jgi:outer membrane protein OmpA-like peptidoglycan-associated protein
MMKKVFLSVFVFLYLLNLDTFGQKNIESKKMVTKAQKFYKMGDWEDALKYFLLADSLEKENAFINYNIGLCYAQKKEYAQSLPYFETAKVKGNLAPDLEYHLGKALHQNHQFESALQAFNNYKSKLHHHDKKAHELDKLIDNCKNGIVLINKPVEVSISNLGPQINSKYADFSPAINADESAIAFTSRRENTTGGQLDPQDNHYFEDIYYATKTNNIWQAAEGVGNEINTNNHDACVGLSASGQEMIVYKTTSAENGDLFISRLIGQTWGKPEDLGSHINSKYWEPSASLLSDGKTIFFTSNRPGGYGGTDIYMSRKDDKGVFGQAILLGAEVNTPYDENSPFIHADGKTLYFSSNGHKSIGGFDIFATTVDIKTGEITSRSENLGYPINTANDDVFFVWSADSKRAYFSSVRAGGLGEKDIYVLERKNQEAALVVYKGKVLDCDNKTPLYSKIVVTDNSTGQMVGIFHTNTKTGEYLIVLPAEVNYGIQVEVESPGYLFYSKNIDISNLKNYEELKDTICVKNAKVGSKFVLRNVFFDVNKSDLRKESENELYKLFQILYHDPKMKILVSGHTDSDADHDHNLKLSDARAHAVRDYLVNKGIEPNRVDWKGYGETRPAYPNDTPENKQLNRRTEVEILED